MLDDMKAGKIGAASDKFIKLSIGGKESMFAERYADELKRLKPVFADINPKIKAGDLIAEIIDADLDRKGTLSVFNTIMSIYARYGNILSDVDSKMVEELASLREETLSDLIRESGVTQMKANRVPFYYWVRERQGSSWAFFRLAKERPGINALPKLVASMKLAASLDNGDWKTAGDILSGNNSMTASELAEIRRLRSWTPSLVYAKGVVALQFGDSKAVDDATSVLNRASASTTLKNAMLPLSLALAMEFAISRRDNRTAIKMGSSYAFNEEKKQWWRIEGRLPLLEILARCSANRKPKKTIQLFLKRYTDIRRLAGDRLWLNAASELILGRPLSPKQIRTLASTKCHFYDTTARVMSSALAQYYVETGKSFPQEWSLISTVEKQVSPSIVSGDLWRRTLLLRLARGRTPQWFEREVSRRMKDLRISATGAYPLLMELKIGVKVALGKLSPEAGQKILADFLKASTVVGKDEIDNLEVMTNADPGSVVKRLFVERRPAAAVRAALLALATRKNSEIKHSVSSILKENASVLQWEELHILRIMERWRR
jgi:hypothetical protein